MTIVQFFRRLKEASWQEESNSARFIAICCLVREQWSFKMCDRQSKNKQEGRINNENTKKAANKILEIR
jgi:hypothetical protein